MIPGSRYRELTASNLRQSARLKRIHPEPICDIHPETAAELGIVDGDWVVIERPEGMITQRARVHDGIRPDTIHPDGYWWEPRGAPGEPSSRRSGSRTRTRSRPSDPALSSYAGDQPLRGARCRVRKAACRSAAAVA